MDEVLLAQCDTNNMEADLGNVDLGRWQPDFILVPWKHKIMAAVDLTQQSDILSAQLAVAYSSKKQKYCPVKSALHHYILEIWTIDLPWVISISGLADSLIPVLQIPRWLSHF
jgi:hypothetical protein